MLRFPIPSKKFLGINKLHANEAAHNMNLSGIFYFNINVISAVHFYR